ncbi:MAG: TIGR03546 family protein [Planctomyces sp.]
MEADGVFFFLRPIRLLLRAMVTESTPDQMSLGLAFGVLLGVIPKGNLLAVALGLSIAALRINLGMAAFAATVCTFCAQWIDPISDQIGQYLLSMPQLQSFWTELYNAPFAAWTSFHHSVVTGGFALGIVLLWPIHRISRPWFAEYMDIIAERTRSWKSTRWLMGAEWADRLGSVE